MTAAAIEKYPERNARWVRLMNAGIPSASIARSDRVKNETIRGVWDRHENRMIREKTRREGS